MPQDSHRRPRARSRRSGTRFPGQPADRHQAHRRPAPGGRPQGAEPQGHRAAAADPAGHGPPTVSPASPQAAPSPAPLQVGQVVELEPHALAAGGDAVARYGGMAVFVPWVAPGDRIRARVTEVKPRYARAAAEAVLAPGPDRVSPTCPLFARCGGCRLQHLSYPAQLAWKRRLVVDALERVGRLEAPPVAETLGMDPPWFYRNKAALPVRRLPGGRVAMGFFAPGTHTVVDLEEHGCAIQHPVINQVAAALRRWLEEDPDGRATSTYDEERHQGLLRHLVVRVGLRTGEALAGLVINGDGLPGEERLARHLQEQVPALAGVVKNLNRRRGNAILGPETVPIAGRPWIVDRLGGLEFRISLESFYQVNPVQAERLYQVALDYALAGREAGSAAMGSNPGAAVAERDTAAGRPARDAGATGARRDPGTGDAGTAAGGRPFWLVDAYAGIGTLALLAAARLAAGTAGRGVAGSGYRVTAIEVVPEATADARVNAERNGLQGVEFINGAVEDVLPRLAAESQGGAGGGDGAAARGGRPDGILLDPPRKGCEPAALAACLELAPPRIVYVSCNPVTLARDLAVLCDTGSPAAPAVHGSGRRRGRRARYRLEAVQPVDMFPHTAHVECAALLVLEEG
ncbi:23S rRNA (uracil(1939)-C(5))-methyltransferase RlmD [Thermaerobacter sp. PB12/4term]|nr:23S rRNA (uracil(1939)-C(5))-methyltransferase RlmD [Thermaerobacter sp. PB12/4term]